MRARLFIVKILKGKRKTGKGKLKIELFHCLCTNFPGCISRHSKKCICTITRLFLYMQQVILAKGKAPTCEGAFPLTNTDKWLYCFI